MEVIQSVAVAFNVVILERCGSTASRSTTLTMAEQWQFEETREADTEGLKRISRSLRSESAFRIARMLGLDPVWWTSFQRGIRCPNRWPTYRSGERAASLPTSSKPAPCGWCLTRGRESAPPRALDLTETALREWVKRARADRTHGRTGLTTAEREELVRLRKALRIAEEERDILKNRSRTLWTSDVWTRNSSEYAWSPEAVAVCFLVSS
jgi:hypothetical protein